MNSLEIDDAVGVKMGSKGYRNSRPEKENELNFIEHCAKLAQESSQDEKYASAWVNLVNSAKSSDKATNLTEKAPGENSLKTNDKRNLIIQNLHIDNVHISF